MDPQNYHYLLHFLQNEVLYEVERSGIEPVKAWQSTLCELISFMLKQGMPMEELSPRPNYHEERRQARNAEETLLAVLNACALASQKQSSIEWTSPTAARAWFMQLQGDRTQGKNPVGFQCLNYLNLSEQDLSYMDLGQASLVGASLNGASLDWVSLDRASLDRASLNGASLVGASLDWASLVGASLDRALFRDNSGLSQKDKSDFKQRGAIVYDDRQTGSVAKMTG